MEIITESSTIEIQKKSMTSSGVMDNSVHNRDLIGPLDALYFLLHFLPITSLLFHINRQLPVSVLYLHVNQSLDIISEDKDP